MGLPRRNKSKTPLRNLSCEAITPLWLVQLVKDFSFGKLDEKETFRFDRPYRTSDLLPFFKAGGDFSTLPDVIKNNPAVLAHPIVWRLLRDLRGVPWRSTSCADLDRENAEEWVRRIVDSWVGAILPGWTLQASKKKRGRNVSWEETEFRRGMVQDYEGLLVMFKKERVTRSPSNEDDMKYFGRLDRMLHRVYSQWHPPPPTNQRPKMGKGQSVNQSTGRRIPYLHKPLMPETVKQWLEKGGLGIGLFSDYLAHCLLSHHYGYRVNQIRSMIQEYRKQNQPR